MPIWMIPALLASKYLGEKLTKSFESEPTCINCTNVATHTTTCCKQPLCQNCAAAFNRGELRCRHG
jgi:hypothetical protein